MAKTTFWDIIEQTVKKVGTPLSPKEIWDKVLLIYERSNGWLGFGKGEDPDEKGLPYWFSFVETKKHVIASVEPSGIQFSGLMENEEWEAWKKAIKEIATEELGYKVGEIELGEVDF